MNEPCMHPEKLRTWSSVHPLTRHCLCGMENADGGGWKRPPMRILSKEEAAKMDVPYPPEEGYDAPLPFTDEELNAIRKGRELWPQNIMTGPMCRRLLATIEAERKKLEALREQLNEQAQYYTSEQQEKRIDELQERVEELEEERVQVLAGVQTLVDVPSCPACTKIIEDVAAGIRGWENAKDERIAELQAKLDGPPLACFDCGLAYGGEGWCDVAIPTDIWVQISPKHSTGGILCFTCMTRRLKRRGFEDVPVAIRSGPWESNDEDLNADPT